MIVVEKNIPIPKIRGGGRPEKYPWAQMQIGDSILIPGANSRTAPGLMRNAVKKYGFKFTVRTVEGGIRVWRIK